MPEKKKKILKRHENFLRKFESSRALDAVLEVCHKLYFKWQFSIG